MMTVFHRLRLIWLVLIGLYVATAGSLATVSGYDGGDSCVLAAKGGDLFHPSMADDFLTQRINSIPEAERLFLIGENQFGRVNPAARSMGAKTATDFWPENMIFDRPLTAAQEAAPVQFNRHLINRLHGAEFRFGDIGPKGPSATSLWYKAELETLEGLGGGAWPLSGF
jgi:hypothetical protein